jgi:branched-chain amino acid transport system ATP-binding protein
MSALLDIQSVSKSFRALRAVTNASFLVEPNTIVALIGPNGAGKTTLFNMVAGVLVPDSGAIWFSGQRIDGFRPDQVCARGIARTFQNAKPFAGLSVLDNVIGGALERSSGIHAARKQAAIILDELDLAPKRNFPASSLTLPDRKKLELARALATRPKLILLDEVMAGMRPTEREQMVALLREINRRDGMTVLLIEHVMRAVMALAAKVIVLHHGEIIAQGSAGQVVRDPTVLECYLGEDSEL